MKKTGDIETITPFSIAGDVIEIDASIVDLHDPKELARAEKIAADCGLDDSLALAEVPELLKARKALKRGKKASRQLLRENIVLAYKLTLAMMVGGVDRADIISACRDAGIAIGDKAHPAYISAKLLISEDSSNASQKAAIMRYAIEQYWSPDDLMETLVSREYTTMELVNLYRDSHPEQRSKRRESLERASRISDEALISDRDLINNVIGSDGEGLDRDEVPVPVWSAEAQAAFENTQVGARFVVVAVKMSATRYANIAISESPKDAERDFVRKKFRAV